MSAPTLSFLGFCFCWHVMYDLCVCVCHRSIIAPQSQYPRVNGMPQPTHPTVGPNTGSPPPVSHNWSHWHERRSAGFFFIFEADPQLTLTSWGHFYNTDCGPDLFLYTDVYMHMQNMQDFCIFNLFFLFTGSVPAKHHKFTNFSSALNNLSNLCSQPLCSHSSGFSRDLISS